MREFISSTVQRVNINKLKHSGFIIIIIIIIIIITIIISDISRISSSIIYYVLLLFSLRQRLANRFLKRPTSSMSKPIDFFTHNTI